MSDRTTCETCGAEIPADAPTGACPACLLGGGLESESPFDRGELTEAFPHLTIGEVLGRGGMGVVYRARQKTLDRDVALKILPPALGKDTAFAERFTREARALAKLTHPNIVTVHEAGQTGDLLYLVMEYVEGVNLRQAQAAGRLAPEKALAIVPQICDALQYAHDTGVVHRDIKPENILIDKSGCVKIADFGLAKLLGPLPADTRLTGTEQVMGTFHYLAPEQIRTPKDVDHRADIYSLGVVFYEMLTGELPIGRFPRPSERVQVDVRLDEVVLRALERERDQRWQKASEVKTGVEGVTSGDASYAPPPPSPAAAAPVAGEERLNPYAVLSILCLPVALFMGLFTVAVGARDEVGAWVGVSIVLIGMILAMIAVHEIRRAPGRYRGLKLAKAAFVIPIVAGVLFGIVLAVVVFIHESTVANARIKSQIRAEKEVVRSVANKFLRDLDKLGAGAPITDLLPLLPPSERSRLLTLTPEERRKMAESGRFGLLRLDRSRLRSRMSKFTVETVEFENEGRTAATVTAAEGEESLRFVLVKDGELWFLALGPVTAVGLGPVQVGHNAHWRALEIAVNQYLEALEQQGGMSDLETVAKMIEPGRRQWFLGLPSDEFQRIYDEGGFGILLFDQSVLKGAISDFRLRSTEFHTAEHATVRVERGQESLTFDLVRRKGEWYLDVGPVEYLAGGHPAERDPEAEVRKQVKGYLASLAALDNRQGGTDVRRMADPEHDLLFFDRERDEFGPEWFDGTKGLAMFDHSVLGSPLSEFGISKVEFDEDDRDRATVTVTCGDESLCFGVVWSERKKGDRPEPAWFLALLPIERFGPNGKIWSGTERAGIQTVIDARLHALPKHPDLSDIGPILAAVDPRERERLRSLLPEELRKLQSEDKLGMAFVDADSLPTMGRSTSASEVKVEGDSGTHTWCYDDHRVTFPIVQFEGKWYLGVGRVRRYEVR